jgi:hypothetical protein
MAGWRRRRVVVVLAVVMGVSTTMRLLPSW